MANPKSRTFSWKEIVNDAAGPEPDIVVYDWPEPGRKKKEPANPKNRFPYNYVP